MDYSQEALELAESVKDPSVGLRRSKNVSLNSIGNIYQLLEQYDLAVEKYMASMALERELGNKLGLAINHQNVGECYMARGDYEAALKNYKQSLSYNEQIDSDKGRVICHGSIAKVYVAQGQSGKAIALLEKKSCNGKIFGRSKNHCQHVDNPWACLYGPR